ncbi:MAG: hypothetical protein ABI779_08925 [Acidobacteriota bacterium]
MMKGYALAVPLPVWQDPQGNLRVTISERGATVVFDCWTDAGDEADYSGALEFVGVWAARVVRSEFVPYQIEEHEHHSYILRVVESSWIEELAAVRKATYTEWPRIDASAYQHYVVAGHDEYAEFVARRYTFERQPPE